MGKPVVDHVVDHGMPHCATHTRQNVGLWYVPWYHPWARGLLCHGLWTVLLHTRGPRSSPWCTMDYSVVCAMVVGYGAVGVSSLDQATTIVLPWHMPRASM